MAKFRQPPYSVAEANIISKSITANGTYNASSDSADGYNPVTVNVPESVIVSKSITANGTYNASADNADGYNPIVVNVPQSQPIPAYRIYTNSAGGSDASLYIALGNIYNGIFTPTGTPQSLLYTDASSPVSFADTFTIQYSNGWILRSVSGVNSNYVDYSANVEVARWAYNVIHSEVLYPIA